MAEQNTPKEQPKTPVQKLQDFLDKENLILNVQPSLVPTNHGTYEIQVNFAVAPKQNDGRKRPV